MPELEATEESQTESPSERLTLVGPAERARLAFGLAELVGGAFGGVGQGSPGHWGDPDKRRVELRTCVYASMGCKDAPAG